MFFVYVSSTGTPASFACFIAALLCFRTASIAPRTKSRETAVSGASGATSPGAAPETRRAGVSSADVFAPASPKTSSLAFPPSAVTFSTFSRTFSTFSPLSCASR